MTLGVSPQMLCHAGHQWMGWTMSNAPELDIERSTGAVDRGPRALDGTAVAWGQRARGRRIAFRVVSALTALLLLAMHVFGMLEVVLMWLPEATLGELFAEQFDSVAELVAHRAHFMSIGIVSWAMVLAVLVQLRKPWRRVAQMLQLLLISVAATVMYALSGTLMEWLLEEWLVLVPVVAMAVLHPRARALASRPTFDRPMRAVAVVAAVPWTVFALVNARLQLIVGPEDLHGAPEHWATAALMGLTLAGCAVLGATHHDGWRMPAWVAALGTLLYGAHSLAFPEAVSAATTTWAVAAVVWGIVFGAVVVSRSRGPSRT